MSAKYPSYRYAVAWIAQNDEPGDRDPETVGEMTTTMLIADLYGKTNEAVARDIIAYRAKHAI